MRPTRRRATLVLLLCCLLLGLPLRVIAAAVLVVTGERGGAYDEAIEALRERVTSRANRPTIADIDWDDYRDAPLEDTRIVVTVGSQAAQVVAQRNAAVPVLNILLPRAAFEAGRHRNGRADHSAIFLDQPPTRQIAAIAEALPQWKRVALISGPQTASLAAELAGTARAAGFDVSQAEIDSERELYAAMRQTLPEPAILLAVPDRQIFNSHTIQNILLTSYRKHSPLFGFSPAYVRAGALLGLYSTPAQIAAQAAEAVLAVLEGGPLPPAGHPEQFTIGINATVARSLGIELDRAEAIAARIRQREEAQ